MKTWRVVPEGLRFRLEGLERDVWIVPIGFTRWEIVDLLAKRSHGIFTSLEQAIEATKGIADAN